MSHIRKISQARTHLTGRLRFFSKSNVVSSASSLPAAFLNALVQRVLRGLYLVVTYCQCTGDDDENRFEITPNLLPMK
jgi:hypothetical protein